jgi:hypothetical protein
VNWSSPTVEQVRAEIHGSVATAAETYADADLTATQAEADAALLALETDDPAYVLESYFDGRYAR